MSGNVGHCWFKVNTEGVPLTCLRGLPLTRKELDAEGGGEYGTFGVSSCCVCVQVCVNVCVYFYIEETAVYVRVYTVA